MKNQQIENANPANEINDLEPNSAEEIKGGQTREHILLARQNQPGVASGDANQDGSISSSDLATWRSNYGSGN